jgi:hypothetical protein
LPALGQETVLTEAPPPALSAPATWRAADHMPLLSVTRNACVWPAPSAYDPPAAQVPAEAQDIEVMLANNPALSAPAASRAADQTPCRSSTVNASVLPGPTE